MSAGYENYAKSALGETYISTQESLVSGYLIDTKFNVNKQQSTSMSLWTPISIPQSAFVSSGVFFDTEMTSESTINFVTNLWLELSVINNAVAAIAPVPTRWLIDRVEIYMGSDLLQQFYSHELWTYLMLQYSNEQLANLSGQNTPYQIENFNNTTLGTSANTIAAGATQKLAFLLPKCIINSSVFLPVITGGRIKIRTYLSGGTSIYTGAQTSGLSLQGAIWYGSGYRLGPNIFNNVFNFYRANKIITRFAYSRQIVQSAGTLSAGNETKIPLNAFLGTFSFMTFWVRVANATGAQLYTVVPVTNWSLLNSAGSPVWSTLNIPNYVFPSMILADKFPTFAGSVNNGQIAMYTYSEAPLESLQRGLNFGSEYSNGLWLVKFVAASSGTFELVCIGSELALCILDGGRVTAGYL